MSYLWQYDSVVEPISTLGEDIKLDKWYKPVSEPVRRSPFKEAVFAASLFFVSVVSPAETITLDKWYQPASEPVRLEQQINYETTGINEPFQLTQAEDILLDKWFVELQRPTLPRIDLNRFIKGEFAPISPAAIIETVTVDKWFRPTEQPLFTKFNPYYYPYFYFQIAEFEGAEIIPETKGGLPGPGGGGRRQPRQEDDEIIFAVANAFVRLMDDGT